MPVKIPSSLPAVEILKAENIFVMDEYRAQHQDMRPLASIEVTHIEPHAFKNSYRNRPITPHLQHAFTNRTRFHERFGTHLPEYSTRTYRYIL